MPYYSNLSILFLTAQWMGADIGFLIINGAFDLKQTMEIVMLLLLLRDYPIP